MSSQPLNHEELAISRLATQYYESTNFRAYIKALMAYSQELEDLFQLMALQTDLTVAEGVNLDVIGIILGRPRLIPESVPIGFFGFLGQPGVRSYGQEGDISKGGRFRGEQESAFATSVLADPEYRRLLVAKIIRNHSHGYNEDAANSLNTLFRVPSVVDSNGVMSMQLAVGRELQYWEQVLIKQLDMVPRPAGVLINQLVTYDPDNYFGFNGQPLAKTFGTEGNPAAGGKFANQF